MAGLPGAPVTASGQWDESKHKRGQPENAGEFGSGDSGAGGGAGGSKMPLDPVAVEKIKERLNERIPGLFGKTSEEKWNGKPGSGNHQTDSPKFKDWFGKSKVVGSDGKPLVVYHGRDRLKQFTEFSIPKGSEPAIFFTDNTKDAREFSNLKTAQGDSRANFVRAFLKMENPKEVDMGGEIYEPETMEKILNKAKAEGHDGVIISNVQNFEGSEPSTSYAVFNPTQIKSISNQGTWSKTDANINASSPVTASGSGLLAAVRAERLARRVEAVRAAADSKTVVKVILQDEAGRVLVLTDSASGWDDLPGGHVQRGEDPVAGLVREVYEETGIRLVASDVTLYREQAIPKPHGGRMLLYKARVGHQAAKLSEEHSGAAWVKRDQLGQRNLGRYAKDVEEASKVDSKASHSAARAKAQSEHKRAATQALALAAHAVADGQTAHPDGKAKIVGGMLAFMALGAAAAYLVAHRELADGEGVSQELELPQADGHAGSRTDFLKPAAEDAVAELEAEKSEVEKEQVARGTVVENELSKRLAKKAKELEGARWERIADTEATATYGAAALRVLDLAGFATVRWSQLDRPTKRHTHKLNQDQGEQPLGFVFQNGQSHPGDPARGPEENINCLCMLLGVRRKEAK